MKHLFLLSFVLAAFVLAAVFRFATGSKIPPQPAADLKALQTDCASAMRSLAAAFPENADLATAWQIRDLETKRPVF